MSVESRATSDDDTGPWAGGAALPDHSLNQASMWVARLHGPARTRQMELECLAWQAQSTANRKAFERATEVWQTVPNLPSAQAHAALSRARRQQQAPGVSAARKSRVPALGLVGLVGLVIASALLWNQHRPRGDAFATGLGEQRQLLLSDGSRVWMNTDTQLRVTYGPAARAVDVASGEALFEVSPDPGRPFVVRAASNEVVALGTLFSVRLTPGEAAADSSLAVSLVEGRVAVRARTELEGTKAPQPIVMLPGQRLRLVPSSRATTPSVQVDRPPVQQMLAWRQNQVVFDDVPLSEAVAEMNRYSRTLILLSPDAAAAGKRVSGMFRTGDNLMFARAAADLHGLQLQQAPGRLELSLSP